MSFSVCIFIIYCTRGGVKPDISNDNLCGQMCIEESKIIGILV